MRIDPGNGEAMRLAAQTNLAQQAGRPGKTAEDAELRQAAAEFESFLLQQLLKQARSASRLLGGDTQPQMPGRDIFESWQDETYASAVSGAGGIGLADLLVRQLQPAAPPVRAEVNESPAERSDVVPPTPRRSGEED